MHAEALFGVWVMDRYACIHSSSSEEMRIVQREQDTAVERRRGRNATL